MFEVFQDEHMVHILTFLHKINSTKSLVADFVTYPYQFAKNYAQTCVYMHPLKGVGKKEVPLNSINCFSRIPKNIF